VRLLAEAGFDQFLDLGTGIPGPGNTGEVARSIRPGARIVYVDNDPIVAVHSRALLAGCDPDVTAVVQADIREPKTILESESVRGVLDFDRPIAVLMVAVLHFIRDAEDPAGIVAAFRDAVPSGSRLVISHGTGDFDFERSQAAVRVYEKATAPFVLRGHARVASFFEGMEVLEPGVVQLPMWRPDGDVPEESEKIWLYGGMAAKV
jgi:hypothetical protein